MSEGNGRSFTVDAEEPGTSLRDIGIQTSDKAPGAGPPELTREATRKLYDERSARLGDELDRMTKLLRWARECLEKELMSGLGYKQMGISDNDLRKLTNLSTSLERAVSAKIRYDKAAKEMAESMTPEEEFESVVAYIKTLPLAPILRLSEIMMQYRARLREMERKEAYSAPEAP